MLRLKSTRVFSDLTITLYGTLRTILQNKCILELRKSFITDPYTDTRSTM